MKLLPRRDDNALTGQFDDIEDKAYKQSTCKAPKLINSPLMDTPDFFVLLSGNLRLTIALEKHCETVTSANGRPVLLSGNVTCRIQSTWSKTLLTPSLDMI